MTTLIRDGQSFTPIDTAILKLVRGGTLPAVGTILRDGASLPMIDTRSLRWHQGAGGGGGGGGGPTFNTLSVAASGADIVLTNNGLTATNGGSTWQNARATNGWGAGKHYAECHLDAGTPTNPTLIFQMVDGTTNPAYQGGNDVHGIAWYNNAWIGYEGVNWFQFGDNWTGGDTMMFAYDGDAKRFWFGQHRDGAFTVWSGDPVAGTGGHDLTNFTNPGYVAVTLGGPRSGEQITMNFGATEFTVTPPTGFVGS